MPGLHRSEAGDALIRKLGVFSKLTEVEKALLAGVTSDVKTVAARKNIIRDGERPEFIHLIVQGWAARYKVLRNGSRQIIAILLPGDFCDLHVTLLGKMDHGIQTLTECRIAYMRNDEVDALTCDHNGLTRALWMATLVDEAVLRSWIVNTGQRQAFGRIAHLLCELLYRMEMVGLVSEGKFDLPLTQEEIGDAVGLTPVHTNRILQRLRSLKLIKTGGRTLTVLDVDGLRYAAGYDPSYLHINQREVV